MFQHKNLWIFLERKIPFCNMKQHYLLPKFRLFSFRLFQKVRLTYLLRMLAAITELC